MFAKFYRAPSYVDGSWQPWADCALLATDRLTSYEYTGRFAKIGSFKLVLPFDRRLLMTIAVNDFIHVDGDWLWIQTISYDGTAIELTGTDAKGLLGLRITEFNPASSDGTQGYDVVEGSTLECVAHYMRSNAISPQNPDRRLPVVGVSGAQGIADDHYMARLEYLSDVVEKLCTNADIGYRMVNGLAGFTLELTSGTDRSGTQTDRRRVIFSRQRRNVLTLRFEHGVDDSYNVIYAEDSNGTVQTVSRDSISAIGPGRRECTVTVSVDATDDHFCDYVLRDVEDHIENHSFTLEPASGKLPVPIAAGGAELTGLSQPAESNTTAGTDFELGDIVTIQDEAVGNLFHERVTEVTKSYQAGEIKYTLVFGKAKQKPFIRLANSLIDGTIRRK